MKSIFVSLILLHAVCAFPQQTPFEQTAGDSTSTYFQVVDFYKKLAASSPKIRLLERGSTDAGYPLHIILLDRDQEFEPAQWKQKKKVVMLINNGIHPGEPDGIDASMMLVRDYVTGKIQIPENVSIAIVALYNIGGALNRTQISRVSQNGPAEYGFRGNAQNLDLNRDFIKSDSKNARSFAEIFHWLRPDIFIDNHVSDGADYQHVISLISTQYDKLGGRLGQWMKTKFDPGLYRKMKDKNWDMVPYVNVEGRDPADGFSMFKDLPRYSTGYAALFNTIAYMPETHMLKPYKQRVAATYDFMIAAMENASEHAQDLLRERSVAIDATRQQTRFPLSWLPDTTRFSMIPFKGYTATTKISGLSGLPVLYYDHSKPFIKRVKHYESFTGVDTADKPAAWIIPAGWWAVTDLLRINGIRMEQLRKDTSVYVTVSHIQDVKSMSSAYEKHHKNTQVSYMVSKELVAFGKNDWIIYSGQPGDRFLVETLAINGQDGYFSWNFFDAVLQQKEWYSDYRWNDIATEFLQSHPGLKKKFDQKVKDDPAFAKNISAQLRWVYERSPYFEKSYKRYPVYTVE